MHNSVPVLIVHGGLVLVSAVASVLLAAFCLCVSFYSNPRVDLGGHDGYDGIGSRR